MRALACIGLVCALAGPAWAGRTPKEIGTDVGAAGSAMLHEALDLVRPRPKAAKVKPQLEALAKRYTDRFVSLGREREELDAAARKELEDASIAREGDLVDKMTELYKSASYYANRDPKLAALINRLPLLPHFARHERLRKMFPADAKRLLDEK